MAIIVPALLADSPHTLLAQAEQVVRLAPLISYDVADGEFVTTRTPNPSGYPRLSYDHQVFWHLMVHEPARYLAECLAVPSQIVAVHAEARGISEALQELQGMEVLTALVINPETTVKSVVPLLDFVEVVQVMTVYPGRQGGQFLPEQLAKVAEFRSVRENLVVAVDGGVNRATIEGVARYRPEYILVGSALTHADDPSDEHRILSRLAAISG